MTITDFGVETARERYESSRAAVADLMRGALLWSACECDDQSHEYPDITEPVYTSTAAYSDVRAAENAKRAAHMVHRVTETSAWKVTK